MDSSLALAFCIKFLKESEDGKSRKSSVTVGVK